MRRSRVAELWRAGATGPQIARAGATTKTLALEEGISEELVRQDLRRLRAKGMLPAVDRKPPTTPAE